MTASAYKGKTILVTGGTGSIGSELVRQLLQHEPESVRVFTNDEDSLFRFRQSMEDERLRYFLGDLRSRERVGRAMKGVDVVFHAGALKHVPICEYNPFEAISVNVLGTQNVVEAALEEEVEAVIGISTDKAVNPINTMGATKLLAEKILLDANYYKGNSATRIWSARFGNVLNSRGSVIPRMRERLRDHGSVQITDPDMTRFVLTIEEAAKVVIRSIEYCCGGEIVVPADMHVMRVGDLAQALIDEHAEASTIPPNDLQVETIGRRSGEKMHEDLFCEEELDSIYAVDGAYVLRQGNRILDDLRSNGNKPVNLTQKPVAPKAVSSGNQTPLAGDELRKLLGTIN